MSLRAVSFRPSDVHITGVRTNWSAIFTGACLTLGIGIFFLLLGNAIGLSAVNTVRTDINGTLKFFSWLYMAVTMIVSYGMGSYFSTKAHGVESSAGVVHGLTSWALSTAAFVGIGSIASIGLRILLAGLASNGANWLAVCIVGLGAVAAAASGYMASASRSAMGPSERPFGEKVA